VNWVQPATRKPEIMMVVRISEMAKPFFEKHGWILVKTQKITRENVELTNHKMEKRLS